MELAHFQKTRSLNPSCKRVRVWVRDLKACNFSKWEIVRSISAALPAFQFSSGLIPGFPHFLVSLLSQFPGIRAASSNKNCLLLNFVQCCWPPDPVSLSSHLLCLHLKFSHPTTFLTSWSVVFLTAVQPLLSDGLFCCLKHLIGGQVYIIRGESLSLPQSESYRCWMLDLFILSSWMHQTQSALHWSTFLLFWLFYVLNWFPW